MYDSLAGLLEVLHRTFMLRQKVPMMTTETNPVATDACAEEAVSSHPTSVTLFLAGRKLGR